MNNKTNTPGPLQPKKWDIFNDCEASVCPSTITAIFFHYKDNHYCEFLKNLWLLAFCYFHTTYMYL